MGNRNTKLYLASGIKLDKSYKNVLDYDENQVLQLVQEHSLYNTETASFIRDRGVIQCDASYQIAMKSNYIAFQNMDYDNKWIFAFITKVKYVSDAVTELEYQVDIWSTWFSYWTTQVCFVSREHVNDDTIGANTIQEDLNVGGMYCESTEIVTELAGEDIYWIIIDTSYNPKDDTEYNGVYGYSGIPFPNSLYAIKVDLTIEKPLSNFVQLAIYLQKVNSKGKISSINNMFIAPNSLVQANNIVQIDDTYESINYTYYKLYGSVNPLTIDKEITKQTTFSDFEPKNSKCFTYPYNFLEVSNDVGNVTQFRYEDFYDQESVIFRIVLAMTIGISGKLIPINYKNISYDEDESLTLAKYPTLAWAVDSYTNWLTQNAVNLSNQAFNTLTSVGSQIANQNSFGALSTLSNSIMSTIGQLYSAELQPDIKGGSNTGDVTWASHRNTFTFKKMRVKTENLRIIDDFFTRFGYKINRLKLPNLFGRTYWNYVEIAPGEEICGANNYNNHYMKTEDIEEVNKICQNGVTVWHNHENVGDYSLDNTINT